MRSNQKLRDRGEHPALVRDQVRQDDVEHRDPVGGHHQDPVVAGVVEVPDLPGIEVRKRDGHGYSPDWSSTSNVRPMLATAF